MEKILGIFLKGFKVREMSNGELRKIRLWSCIPWVYFYVISVDSIRD